MDEESEEFNGIFLTLIENTYIKKRLTGLLKVVCKTGNCWMLVVDCC